MTIYKAKATEIIICKTVECSNCATEMPASAYNDSWSFCPFCGEEIENLETNDKTQ